MNAKTRSSLVIDYGSIFPGIIGDDVNNNILEMEVELVDFMALMNNIIPFAYTYHDNHRKDRGLL